MGGGGTWTEPAPLSVNMTKPFSCASQKRNKQEVRVMPVGVVLEGSHQK